MTKRKVKKERLPEWMRGLEGVDELVVVADGQKQTTVAPLPASYKKGLFRVEVTLPNDVTELKGIDPLIAAHLVSRAAADLDLKLMELIDVARKRGKTWEQIGEAIGTTRQAAWERHRRKGGKT